MTECPKCEAMFRGFRCECGYEPPKPKAEDVSNRRPWKDTKDDIEHRRERLEAIKRQFHYGRTA